MSSQAHRSCSPLVASPAPPRPGRFHPSRRASPGLTCRSLPLLLPRRRQPHPMPALCAVGGQALELVLLPRRPFVSHARGHVAAHDQKHHFVVAEASAKYGACRNEASAGLAATGLGLGGLHCTSGPAVNIPASVRALQGADIGHVRRWRSQQSASESVRVCRQHNAHPAPRAHLHLIGVAGSRSRACRDSARVSREMTHPRRRCPPVVGAGAFRRPLGPSGAGESSAQIPRPAGGGRLAWPFSPSLCSCSGLDTRLPTPELEAPERCTCACDSRLSKIDDKKITSYQQSIPAMASSFFCFVSPANRKKREPDARSHHSHPVCRKLPGRRLASAAGATRRRLARASCIVSSAPV